MNVPQSFLALFQLVAFLMYFVLREVVKVGGLEEGLVLLVTIEMALNQMLKLH